MSRKRTGRLLKDTTMISTGTKTQELQTTQMCLGRISEAEALHWMEVLHGRQPKSGRGLLSLVTVFLF
jgi:hypothetical protein